jgi:predicted unusual protein kinase regulating ubiquinone biosynthesis (AarF/ABC1/UbiB family)
VHRATLHDGRTVAVKVLRPGIEQTMATDLGIMEPGVRAMARAGIDQAYNLVALIKGLRAQVAEELDLRNEARTMDIFRELFREFGLNLLVVPTTEPSLSARRVLTMEFLEGTPIDDFARAEAAGIDPRPLVRELLRAWILTGLRASAFHADIHAGNLLLLRDGRLGMLDWGIVARMDEDTYKLMRMLVQASIGEEHIWAEIAAHFIEIQGPAFEVLGLTDDQMVRLVRELMEPALTKPLSEVSMASLLMTGDDVVRLATGEAPARKTLRDRWRGMRLAARSYRESLASGAFENTTMRMSFLATKQLVYLERYGRMYIPDESILQDHDFLRAALAAPPADAVSVAAG